MGKSLPLFSPSARGTPNLPYPKGHNYKQSSLEIPLNQIPTSHRPNRVLPLQNRCKINSGIVTVTPATAVRTNRCYTSVIKDRSRLMD